MATTPAPTTGLLTAEEFARRPDPGYPEELVRGRIVAAPIPGFRHGLVCAEVVFELVQVVSVRGPDVSFYRYDRLGKDQTPVGYPEVPPNLVVEVLSPEDRWSETIGKVGEYLNAGVSVVVVPDPERRTAHVFDGADHGRVLNEGDELVLPGVLEGFRVPVGRFFPYVNEG